MSTLKEIWQIISCHFYLSIFKSLALLDSLMANYNISLSLCLVQDK